MSEPLGLTGDPWIDAYLTFRRAWLDGATEGELADLATEARRSLPSPTPPIPAALFIHRDILITSEQGALPRQLVTALWVPEGVGTRWDAGNKSCPATDCHLCAPTTVPIQRSGTAR